MGMDSNEVKFDRSELKVLASGTRVEILKNLKARNYTVSELAQRLGHSKSTLHEHLERLMDANLIEKADNYTDKWVYYRLSRRGKELFADSGKRLVVIISSILLAIGILQIAVFFLSAQLFVPQMQYGARAPAPEMGPAGDSTAKTYDIVGQATPAAEKVLSETAATGGAQPEAAGTPRDNGAAEAPKQEFPYLLAGGVLFILAAFIVGQKYRSSPEKMFLEKKRGGKWEFGKK